MNKKAVLASQMTWIFVLIVGAFIFLLSYRIVSIHQSISNEKLTLRIASLIKTNIEATASSRDIKTVIQTFGGTIKNSCEGLEISESQQLPIYVFSKDSITSTTGRWLIFSHPFKFPMISNNIISLVDPRTVFVFVYDKNDDVQSRVVSKIEALLPSDLNLSVHLKVLEEDNFNDAASALKSFGDAPLSLICFEDPTSNLNQLNHFNINIYQVSPYQNGEFGNVTFYSKSSSGIISSRGSLPYFNYELLTAYTCSDYDVASCNLVRLLASSEYILKVYSGKLKKINVRASSNPSISSDCISYSSSVITDSNVAINILKLIDVVDYPSFSNKQFLDAVEKIQTYAPNLWRAQKTLSLDNEALKEESCPTLY